MAIVANFWLKKSSKRLAGAVLYQAMGQTRARELASSVSNPRTEAQQSQRVKWANLVAFYRVNRGWMKYAFETKKESQSEYNKMMSLNVSSSPIYLTKQEAAGGACVVAPYIMTQGSLPSINYSLNGSKIQNNIYVQAGTTIGTETTVGEFAKSVIAANPAFKEGDQLSFIRFTQMVNEGTGYPYVIVRKYEVLLDSSSSDLFFNYWPADIIPSREYTSTSTLEMQTTGNSGGLLIILSRTSGGKTYVSTQTILPVNNQTIISAYSSAAHLAAAIASYGESEDAFLSTDNANYGENQDIILAPLSLMVDNVSFVAGDYVGTLADIKEAEFDIVFNQAFTNEIGNVWFDFVGGTASGENPTASGRLVSVPSINAGTIEETAALRAVRVIDAIGTEYRINFATSQGGLE